MLTETPSSAVYAAGKLLATPWRPAQPPPGFSAAVETVLQWATNELAWRKQLEEQAQCEVTVAWLKDFGFQQLGEHLVLHDTAKTWEILYDQFLVGYLCVDRRRCRVPLLTSRGRLQALLFYVLPGGDEHVRKYFDRWREFGGAAAHVD